MLFLIGEEVLGAGILAGLHRELDIESEKSAWSFANTVLTLQFILLVIVACALCLAPSLAVNVLTHWRPDSTPEKYALATQSVRTLAPALIGLSLGSTTYVLLNSYKRFFLAAFGDAVWKFAVVFFLVIGAMFAYDSAQVLMWGSSRGRCARSVRTSSACAINCTTSVRACVLASGLQAFLLVGTALLAEF